MLLHHLGLKPELFYIDQQLLHLHSWNPFLCFIKVQFLIFEVILVEAGKE